VTDRVIRNVVFDSLNIDSAATDRNVVSAWQVENFAMPDSVGVGGAGLQTGRDLIDCRMERARFHGQGTATTMQCMSCGASGTSDFLDEGSEYAAELFLYVQCMRGWCDPRCAASACNTHRPMPLTPRYRSAHVSTTWMWKRSRWAPRELWRVR
jgi:hypothetical protein